MSTPEVVLRLIGILAAFVLFCTMVTAIITAEPGEWIWSAVRRIVRELFE